MHEGLILLIMKYAKVHNVKPSLILRKPKPLDSQDVHVVSHTKFDENEEGGMFMDWNGIHVSDDLDYRLSEDEVPSQKLIPSSTSNRKSK